jgi:hypothetical protein
MAFAATASTKEPRSFSIGPLKVQIFTYSVASGDTSGTITATGLKEAFHVIVDGDCGRATSAPTFSGNVVTLAFTNPAATKYGTAIVIGR